MPSRGVDARRSDRLSLVIIWNSEVGFIRPRAERFFPGAGEGAGGGGAAGAGAGAGGGDGLKNNLGQSVQKKP